MWVLFLFYKNITCCHRKVGIEYIIHILETSSSCQQKNKYLNSEELLLGAERRQRLAGRGGQVARSCGESPVSGSD